MSDADLAQPAGTQEEGPVSRPDLPQLCRNALHSSDPRALEQLRRHAKAVMDSLGDEQMQIALTVESSESVPSERIAAVYELLSQAEPFPALTIDTRELALKADLEEEERIGHDFAEGLMCDLKGPLANLLLVFAEVPRVSRKEQRHLRQTGSVRSVWHTCEGLAGLVACGLTPLGVFYASDTPFPLAKRLQDSGLMRTSEPVVLSYVQRSLAPPQPLAAYAHDVVQEVLQVAHCSQQAAETLIDWLIDVARLKPLIFSGARAEQHEFGVTLTAEEDYSNMSLSDRWRDLGDAFRSPREIHNSKLGTSPPSRPRSGRS
jgi:hypothetical protein